MLLFRLLLTLKALNPTNSSHSTIYSGGKTFTSVTLRLHIERGRRQTAQRKNFGTFACSQYQKYNATHKVPFCVA